MGMGKFFLSFIHSMFAMAFFIAERKHSNLFLLHFRKKILKKCNLTTTQGLGTKE